MSPRGHQGVQSWFNTCVRSGEGILLYGQANHPPAPPTGWLVRLDKGGQVIWEKVDPELAAMNDMLELQDGRLLVAVRAPVAGLLKLDKEGKVLAKKQLGGYISFVRPLFETATIRVIVTDPDTRRETFWSLDQELRELTHTRSHALGVRRAYELSDHSLLLFGGANTRGGSATAAIARLYPDNEFGVSPLEPLYESAVLLDAVPTNAPGEYAMIRTLTHPVPGTPQWSTRGTSVSNETVLAWLKIN